jgi:hypothetical protein
MLAIVIPYYKLTFFEETLLSLSNQTDKRFKVYIGDDASPEGPNELIDKCKNHFNIVYKKFDENLGAISLTKQWERCIALSANEEWIMILGDDDVLGDNVVEEFHKNLPEINTYMCKVIRIATKIIDSDGDPISDKYIHPLIEKATDILHRKLSGQTRSSLSEYVFKKENLLKVGFYNFPLGWHSDEMAILQVTNFGSVFTINNSVVKIRESKINISGILGNLKEKDQASYLFYNILLNSHKDNFNLIQKKMLLTVQEHYLKNNKKFNIYYTISKHYWKETDFYSFYNFQLRFINLIYCKIFFQKNLSK